MNYAEWAKANGVKLELSPFRGERWRKYKDGKMRYFNHPLTKEGYHAALEEWILLKAQLAGERPNAQTYHHHQKLFGKVIEYYEAFGTPLDERDIHREVKHFLDFLHEQLQHPVLDVTIPVLGFCQDHPAFKAEFLERPYSALGMSAYDLPVKWHDRIARMEPAKLDKVPQTIEYWVEAYLKRVDERIDKDSAKSRRYKMANFKKYADLQSHVSVIDNKYVENYHRHVEQSSVVRDTKISYFETFRMMTRWCGRQDDCDLSTPSNLDSREFTFVEPMGTGRKRMQRKKLLWTRDEFDLSLKLPEPYRCYCLLMLNCGFRHKDISQLQHDDLHLSEARIVIQRNKLNQQVTAPVISYPLWTETIDSIVNARKEMPKDSKFVFRNEDGGPVAGALKTWWKRNAEEYGIQGKRLDMLRKTGSTVIARFNQHLDEMYLGETLSTTTKIHYSFVDGEPNPELDKAIAHLGAQFGLAEEPTQTVELSAAALEVLRQIQKTGKATKKAIASLQQLDL